MTIDPDPLCSQALAFATGAEKGQQYLQRLSSRAVCADKADIAKLRFPLPQAGLGSNDVLDLIESAGANSSVASAAGRYFGYVIGGSLPAASGARAMLSAWDQCANADTGPSVVAMESTAIDWVTGLLDLPPQVEGCFTTGATMANLTLLATARDRQLDRLGHARGKGLIGAPALRVVASAEIHATVLKSLRMIGLGSDNIEFVPTDAQGRMRAELLPDLDASCIVLTQAGNVCTGASDPFDQIAGKCEAAGAWLHVDGAFGLWARISDKIGNGLTGLERADSWVVDAHKTLNAPYDSGIALCKHPEEMRASMAIGAGYLPAVDPTPADLAPEFSRAARGAETWAALLSLGQTGLKDMVNRFHSHALDVAKGLRALGFEIPHDVAFNQVFATLPGREDACAEITAHVQNSGEAWFGPATWQGRKGFRISVSNWATTPQDIDRLIGAVRAALANSQR